MAKRRRTRARSSRRQNASASESSTRQERSVGEIAESSMVPQILLGAVNGVEAVAGGLLQLTRNVLLSAVSGAADIGAEALTASLSGVRGVVSAASRMVGNIAGAAQTSFQEVVASARQSRGPVSAGMRSRRPLASMAGRSADSRERLTAPADEVGSRRQSRRPPATSPARAGVAA